MNALSSFCVSAILFVAFRNLLAAQGSIVCHFCNSKEGSCSTSSLNGARHSSCARDYAYCSLYRKVFPNGTTAQIVRGCDRQCERPLAKWTVGTHQPTTHCKLCCSSNLCNDYSTDPCSGARSLLHELAASLLLATLGLWLH